MAAKKKMIALNCAIVINSTTTLTTNAKSVHVSETADKQEVTAFGGSGYKEYDVGLKDGVVTVSFYQGFSTDGAHAALRPLFDSGETFELAVFPDGSVIAEDNPVWRCDVRLYNDDFLNAEVGQPSMKDCEFQLAGVPSIDIS